MDAHAAVPLAKGATAGILSSWIIERRQYSDCSENASGDCKAIVTSKFLSHRRRPVPMPNLGPGLRREDKAGDPR
jgi:hypothetical protein